MRVQFLASMFIFVFTSPSFGEGNFEQWVKGFKAEAMRKGISSSLVDKALNLFNLFLVFIHGFQLHGKKCVFSAFGTSFSFWALAGGRPGGRVTFDSAKVTKIIDATFGLIQLGKRRIEVDGPTRGVCPESCRRAQTRPTDLFERSPIWPDSRHRSRNFGTSAEGVPF